MRPSGRSTPWALLLTLGALGACKPVSPLSNRIAVGAEPVVIVVGEGPDGWTDLFIAGAAGGEVTRFTFTRQRESSPALDPSGAVLAFLRRGPDPADTVATLVVMNLVNAAERAIPIPAELGSPDRIAWSADGGALYVRGHLGIARTDAPPAALALTMLDSASTEVPSADSAFRVTLGSPPIARIESCALACIAAAAGAECVVMQSGTRLDLGAGRGPFRWGADSLGYFDREQLIIRPLGGGRTRAMEWVGAPRLPRQAIYWEPAPGAAPPRPSAPPA